ncbi:transglutaminaseTgpA domain-containing protein [Candidatus Poriferisocius sp.]|uniref:transglutaminase family protein n=1 Tax=Candidatus Poriferisocius sp. TaxID=3101276 RepID=UPI003B02D77C
MIPSRGSNRRQSAGWEAGLEIAGPTLTAATAFSLVRTFEGSAWILPVAIAAAVSHLLALAVRRIGWGMLISTLATGVGLVATVTWTLYWDTAFWGLPTGGTRTALADDLEEAWTAFGDLSPPVEPLDGFIVSAMAAVWLVAFVNDWTAMRTRTVFEPMVLPILAFGFVGLVGGDQHRILTIGVFTAALLAFASVHRVAARAGDAVWLGGDGRASTGRRALLAGSAAIAAVALAAAIAAGPVLGSDEDPIIDLAEAVERDRRSSGRVVISPLVDIRGRLVSQSETVMFRVKSQERSYWRLTSLDRFDGQVWTSRADYAARPTQLPSLFQSGSSVQESVQEFSIEQLGAVWLPAAFEPRSLVVGTDGTSNGKTSSSDISNGDISSSDISSSDISNSDISYEPSSSTLIVGRSLATSNGLTYTVSSALPRFDPEVLKSIPLDAAGNSAGNAAEYISAYTALPSGFSPQVKALAERLTAGAESGYEQALALQDFFRNGGFVYDANAASGHSANRIEEFLDTRRGYCEQFAGTFAAMARSLGLPARVAVGFTVGEADLDDPNHYVVRGKHAHAWPEVHLFGVGWVAFEPTPGRGAPGAQNYTGLAENQAISGSEVALPEEDSATDQADSLNPPTDFESLIPPELDDLGGTLPPAGSGRGGLTWRTWIAISASLLVVLTILLIPWFKQIRNQRRFLRVQGNRGKIRLLWDETVESLAQISMVPRLDETYAEFARRAIEQIPLHSPDLRQLGELTAAATFAPTEPSDRNQWLARTWSLSVRAEVNFRVSRRQKLMAAYSPRPLFGSRFSSRHRDWR